MRSYCQLDPQEQISAKIQSLSVRKIHFKLSSAKCRLPFCCAFVALYQGPILLTIPAWINNNVSNKVWDEITYSFPNFNGCTVEVWKWCHPTLCWTCDYLSMLATRHNQYWLWEVPDVRWICCQRKGVLPCIRLYSSLGGNIIICPTYCACGGQWPTTMPNSLLACVEAWACKHGQYLQTAFQNGHHFANDIFKYVILLAKFCILIQTSLRFLPSDHNKPALVQIMAWCRTGDTTTIWTNDGLVHKCICITLP